MSESTKDFQTLLDTIASGVYGKDIRGAIHDALEAMNQRIGEVKPQTGGKQKTVYCWGDSLTQGVGGNVNGWHLISYPQVLSERCNAVNLGILSDNVPTIMARMGADAIVLPACTIPGSSSESVVVGNTTDGMTLESGRIGKLLKYGDCGINPCYVNDVPCVLFRDYAKDTSDGLSIRLRRLDNGLPVVVSAGTKLITYGAKHYKGNGLHIFWMGANGGYGSDAEGKNLDFSDYVAQLQKCVDYVAPADYLIIYARERKGYATDEAAEVQELKETFKGHLIDLLPQLNDRGLLYGETNVWDGTLVKGVPKTLDSGDGCHYSFYGYMAIGKIVWEYVAPRLLNASEEKRVHAGSIVKGIVTSISANEIQVDIGAKQTGFVKLSELTDDSSAKVEDLVKVGDELDLIVEKVMDQDGVIQLSRKKLASRKGMEEIAKAAESGEVVEGDVTEFNKGGVVVNVKGVKVFVPRSQATMRRDEDYTKLVGQHVKLVITECAGRKIVGSINKVTAEQNKAKREEFWANVEVGKTYTGVVKSLTSYGAFVDIGGVDGLCHISELSWNRIKHPSEVVSVGDTIEVYVKDIDTENHKVSLGYKKAEDNPWEQLKNNYPIGSTFHAPVVSLTKFGAFVRILPGVDGLVHISEISNERVNKVSDVLKVGDMVKVKLINVDFDRKRISLSMKALLNDDAE